VMLHIMEACAQHLRKNPSPSKPIFLLTLGKFYSMRIVLEIWEWSNVDGITVVEEAKALQFPA
jgi:hypothetical protein